MSERLQEADHPTNYRLTDADAAWFSQDRVAEPGLDDERAAIRAKERAARAPQDLRTRAMKRAKGARSAIAPLYPISHAIPLPAPIRGPKATRQRPSAAYPFKSMEIGDSFAVEIDERHRVQTAASAYGRYHGDVKFSIRAYRGRFRVWRIA